MHTILVYLGLISLHLFSCDQIEVDSFCCGYRSAVGHMMTMSSMPSPEPVERRSHKNKYSKFATKETDPLEAAMKKSNDKVSEEKIKAESFSPVRGTTVPMRYKGNVTKQPVIEETKSSTIGTKNSTMAVNIFFQNHP